jgi:VWFA-related protein
MKKISFTFSLFFFVVFTFSLSLKAQTPSPTAVPPTESDGEVVKISTTLIQVDATVTDRKGNIVTDLKPEDFEVYENGKKQEITNFSFISVDSKSMSKATAKSPKLAKDSIPIPPIKLKAEQVRRSYALVVDDLGLNFANIFWVQQSLRKFVNEQMQEAI